MTNSELNSAYNHVYDFYNCSNPNPTTSDQNKVQDRPAVPDFDFHKGLALLADHPTLMRRLGLVLDFSLDLPASATGSIRIKPPRGLPADQDIIPFTYYIHNNPDQFLADTADPADPASGILVNGFLNLKNAKDEFLVEDLGMDQVPSRMKVRERLFLWRDPGRSRRCST